MNRERYISTLGLHGLWFCAAVTILLFIPAQSASADAVLATYHVDPAGSDTTGDGSAGNPWQTIQQCADVAVAGDTCTIHAGTYREEVRPANSGTAGSPIRFVAAGDGDVIVSGAEPITSAWTQHSGNIYKTTTTLSFEQLFADGDMMTVARWPNTPPADLMFMNRAEADDSTATTVVDTDLPAGDWTGGTMIIWPGKGGAAYSRFIDAYTAGTTLTYSPANNDTTGGFVPEPGDTYILFNALDGLDSGGEWYLDDAADTLYYMSESGTPSSELVEVKQRTYAFNLQSRNYIEVEDIDIFSVGINMKTSQYVTVRDGEILYPAYFLDGMEKWNVPESGIVMTGNNNLLERMHIAYSAGAAVKVVGSFNEIRDSIIHDSVYYGGNRQIIHANASLDVSILNNTIYNGGRGLVSFKDSERVTIQYNHFYGSNAYTNDTGALKSWGTEGQGSEISYNWIHDHLGGTLTAGIYFDNYSHRFSVHHNVIWGHNDAQIRLNSSSLGHDIYNNTMQGEPAFRIFTYSSDPYPDQTGTEIINNIYDGTTGFAPAPYDPVVTDNSDSVVDAYFRPLAGEPAIDAGQNVGFGFVGSAPDHGAYESGDVYWVPGSSLDTNSIFDYLPTAPSPIDTTYPLNGETNVPVDLASVRVYFIANIAPADMPQITLSPSASTGNYNGGGTAPIRLPFTADLQYNTTYVVTIPAGVRSVENVLITDEPYTFSFTTELAPTPTPTNTPLPTATNTPLPTATNTPLPTATNTPLPTATNTPLPTATNTPLPTATNTPLPTATNTPLPTATFTLVPTVVPGEPTHTPSPIPTDTPLPTATNTPLPTATNTPLPTATNTIVPTQESLVPTATPTLTSSSTPAVPLAVKAQPFHYQLTKPFSGLILTVIVLAMSSLSHYALKNGENDEQ